MKRWLLLLPILAVYLLGMYVDVMEIDAAQYAAMSREMSETGNFLKIYYRGEDYIDKPPLLFWTSAWSFKLFGVSNFTYKLPSILFTLLGLFATYRLARMFYGKVTGYFAVLILASCHAWFQFNQDVRTDAILAGSTIFAIWQLAVYARNKSITSLFWASTGIAAAMMAKGPIGLMVPVLAVGTDLLLKRKWNVLFRWQWLLVLPVVLILLTPMLIGLYQQFDASGGRQTYNGFITSGLKFYFWTQSFGRITGESTWKNDTSSFFFVHTFLWAFLPWSLLALVSLGRRIKKIAYSGFIIRSRQEALTIGGTVFPFIAFSLSNYKLPHYIFVLFPLMAILTATYARKLVRKHNGKFKGLRITQGIVSVLLLSLAVTVSILFPLKNVVIILVAVAGMVASVYSLFFTKSYYKQLIFPSFFAVITLNFVFNSHFYPELLKFESGNIAAQIAAERNERLVGLRSNPYGMNFYSNGESQEFTAARELARSLTGATVVYTDFEGVQEMKEDSIQIESDTVLKHFHVSTLRGRFLNPQTRDEAVSDMHLVRVVPGKLYERPSIEENQADSKD